MSRCRDELGGGRCPSELPAAPPAACELQPPPAAAPAVSALDFDFAPTSPQAMCGCAAAAAAPAVPSISPAAAASRATLCSAALIQAPDLPSRLDAVQAKCKPPRPTRARDLRASLPLRSSLHILLSSRPNPCPSPPTSTPPLLLLPPFPIYNNARQKGPARGLVRRRTPHLTTWQQLVCPSSSASSPPPSSPFTPNPTPATTPAPMPSSAAVSTTSWP